MNKYYIYQQLSLFEIGVLVADGRHYMTIYTLLTKNAKEQKIPKLKKSSFHPEFDAKIL
jgi:hypothetical protein